MSGANLVQTSTCFNCREPGHFARDCRNIRQVEEDWKVEEIRPVASRRERGVKTVKVNGKEWTARVDTEAEVSIMAKVAADELGLQLDTSAVKRLRGIGGGSTEPIGQTTIHLEADGLEVEDVTVTVLPNGAMYEKEILLGKDLLGRGLVTVYCEGQSWILNGDAFKEISKVLPKERVKVDLELKEEVTLEPKTVAMVRTVPLGRKEGLLIIKDQEEWGALCEI